MKEDLRITPGTKGKSPDLSKVRDLRRNFFMEIKHNRMSDVPECLKKI